MRDFFWFFILTLAMYVAGDYYTTAKTINIVSQPMVSAKIASEQEPETTNNALMLAKQLFE